jgi:hypothetical protein
MTECPICKKEISKHTDDELTKCMLATPQLSIPPKVQDFINTVNNVKVRTLSLATRVEHMIEVILVDYYTFSKSEYQSFHHTFFNERNEITFGVKIGMLMRFLEKEHPEILKNYTDLENSLTRVRKIRNRYAHAMNQKLAEIDPEKTHFILEFVENNQITKETVSFREAAERILDFKNIVDSIDAIFKELQEKKKKRPFNSQ